MSPSTPFDDAVRSVDARLDANRVDDVLSDSFPASDPPSWNPGITRPRPIIHPRSRRAGADTAPVIATGHTMTTS
jgi:hypothetical protein